MKRTLVCALILFSSVSAFAQNQRTFLSGNGLDSNPCIVTSPCRSISVALGVTNSGGEIVVLDSAGYGATVTINKSVNIVVPPGIFGAMTPTTPGTIALNIAAAGTDTIRVDGLQILGSGVASSQIGVSVGTCARADLSRMNIKSVAYPIKVIADARVFIQSVEASVFSTGIWLTGVNANPVTTTLKVFVVGSSFTFGTLGVQADTGAIQMQGSQVGLDGNRLGYLTTGSWFFGVGSAQCSQVPYGAFSNQTNTDNRTAGGVACSAP
jgi:hypothetical protein